MIRAFPEARLVVAAVDVALGIATPEPLAALAVDEVVLDVLPAVQRLLQRALVAEVLIQVNKSYHSLGLYPPVAVVIDIAGVKIGLVYHRPVGIQAFFAGFCHEFHDGFHFVKHGLVAQHQCRLVHEP